MTTASDLPPLRDDIRALALNYAPTERRLALHALWALDEALAAIVRTTTEPLIGQLRLTWWHERLTKLGDEPGPGEPILRTLAETSAGRRLPLARMIDGWEGLLETLPLGEAAIRLHARARGGSLFAAAAELLNDDTDVAHAGEFWALVDLSRHMRNVETGACAVDLACQRRFKLPDSRPLRILTRVAQDDVMNAPRRSRSAWQIAKAVLF